MDPKPFYDQFKKKLISDYVIGNPRTITSIKKMIEKLPIDSENVLDIGCGIGWSSFVLKKNHPNLNIISTDLSQELLDVGKTLFGEVNLKFFQQDFTKPELEFPFLFDYIVLLDVFEHLPIQIRKDFGSFIKKVIAQNGSLFLSCPTIYHQGYLKENNPKGLHPIDEDVTLKDLISFAEEIEGEITYFEFVSIWNTNDYFYCKIQVNPPFKPYRKTEVSNQIENYNQRLKRVSDSAYYELFSESEKEKFQQTKQKPFLYRALKKIKSFK